MIHPYYTIGLRDWVPAPSNVYEAYYFRHNVLTDEETSAHYKRTFPESTLMIRMHNSVITMLMSMEFIYEVDNNILFQNHKVFKNKFERATNENAHVLKQTHLYALYINPYIYEFKNYKYDAIKNDRAALNADIIKSVESIGA
jgi:hypothetical protein